MKLCGIDTALLALRPTPEELAAIVARMAPADVATFIALWSEQIDAHHGPRAGTHISLVAEEVGVEAFADRLIRDLAKALPR